MFKVACAVTVLVILAIFACTFLSQVEEKKEEGFTETLIFDYNEITKKEMSVIVNAEISKLYDEGYEVTKIMTMWEGETNTMTIKLFVRKRIEETKSQSIISRPGSDLW